MEQCASHAFVRGEQVIAPSTERSVLGCEVTGGVIFNFGTRALTWTLLQLYRSILYLVFLAPDTQPSQVLYLYSLRKSQNYVAFIAII